MTTPRRPDPRHPARRPPSGRRRARSFAGAPTLFLSAPRAGLVVPHSLKKLNTTSPLLWQPEPYRLPPLMSDALTSPDEEIELDLPDEVPGGRHSIAADSQGKGAWLARYGLTPADLANFIVTVASHKGGVGKTFLAYELAYMLGAILLDLDWDDGNASGAWGYNAEDRVRPVLLDALDSGRVPRPLAGGPWRPDLVPCSKDFGVNQPSATEMTKTIIRWAAHWANELKRPLVIDTHPGGAEESTSGAIAAGHVTVVPVVFEERPVRATVGMMRELKSYPLLLVPNMVPNRPPDRLITLIEREAARAKVPIGPVIAEHKLLRSRGRRMAVTASDPVPKNARKLVDELYSVGELVVGYARAGA